MTCSGKTVVWLVGIGMLLLGMTCLGIPGADLPVFLIGGWIAFLTRVIPAVHVRWDLVWSTAVYAVLLLVGSHYFLRWLYHEMSAASTPPRGNWRWRWTASLFALVMLMFVAGTAAVGVVHQTAWLARSPRPLYQRSDLAANRVKCQSNLRQLGMALDMYSKEHGGKYPDDWDTLLLNEDLTAAVFICPSSSDIFEPDRTREQAAADLKVAGHCSYIYLGKGLSAPVDAKRVIATEMLENHDDGVNVLYGDGSVEWLPEPQARELFTRLGISGPLRSHGTTSQAY